MLLLIPALVMFTAIYLPLVLIVSVLHLLFQGLHLHRLAKNMTDPLLSQFIRLSRWGQKLVDQRQKEAP